MALIRFITFEVLNTVELDAVWAKFWTSVVGSNTGNRSGATVSGGRATASANDVLPRRSTHCSFARRVAKISTTSLYLRSNVSRSFAKRTCACAGHGVLRGAESPSPWERAVPFPSYEIFLPITVFLASSPPS
jgi:hypothetical protein